MSYKRIMVGSSQLHNLQGRTGARTCRGRVALIKDTTASLQDHLQGTGHGRVVDMSRKREILVAAPRTYRGRVVDVSWTCHAEERRW